MSASTGTVFEEKVPQRVGEPSDTKGEQGEELRVNSCEASLPAKLLLDGDVRLVSTVDLLAVVIGDAAAPLLSRYPKLSALDDASPHELGAIPEVSEDAVTRLVAVRELGRRRAIENACAGKPILTPDHAVGVLEPLLRGETREVLMVLALDTKKRLLTPPITIAIGTVDSAPCHPREIFRPLIRASASSCVVAHLHPSSGEPVPSPEDIMMTERLREAGQLLGIAVVDHIVIGRGSYLSMAERGLL